VVYATKENDQEINRVARLSFLSRKQVLQAMSNERKRLETEGSTIEELKRIKEAGRLSTELKELQKCRKQYVNKRRCPAGLHDKAFQHLFSQHTLSKHQIQETSLSEGNFGSGFCQCSVFTAGR
jgi:hypothetical protein